jgi:uridylate kinase
MFDIVACKLAARSGIEIVFANGKKLDQLRKLVEGRGDCGTIVG